MLSVILIWPIALFWSSLTRWIWPVSDQLKLLRKWVFTNQEDLGTFSLAAGSMETESLKDSNGSEKNSKTRNDCYDFILFVYHYFLSIKISIITFSISP